MHCRRNSPAGALAPHASPKLNCLRAVGSAVPLQASRITMPDNAAFTVVVYDNAFGNILAVPGRSVGQLRRRSLGLAPFVSAANLGIADSFDENGRLGV